MLEIYDYDFKKIVDELRKKINIGGQTFEVVLLDQYLFDKENVNGLENSSVLKCKPDHSAININAYDEDNKEMLTEEYSGWVYEIINGLYLAMLVDIVECEKSLRVMANRLSKSFINLYGHENVVNLIEECKIKIEQDESEDAE